ncbi:Flp pilus assembly protein CpaB [Actinomadura bangladeshensis]|uniref:Flp pilus assembly protein CpaB n=2 Tax=Actinomadura bangladeshensis TaxID=453573 RepID=A0A4R4NSR7_9ACTN|nr:Flp pilus assembly protein CpaB [Actinomadura bangladeshensis]
MNPRQRRGVLLMILAAIGAVAVFVSVVSYVGSVRAEVGIRTSVLKLKQPVPAYTTVTSGMLERIEVPRKWTPPTMISDLRQLAGQVAATDLPQGAYLERGMLIPAPDLKPGQREIAIMIDAETGVAGKVKPGMRVDIFARQVRDGQVACASRVIRAARVIQVGEQTRQRGQNPADVEEVVPVTFALSLEDTQNLTYIESNSAKVRLALIGPGQADEAVQLAPLCTNPKGR